MKKFHFIKLAIVLGVICLDLITKEIFYATDYTIIPYVFGTRSVGLNTGAAWSVLSDHTWLLVAFTIVFIIGIAVFDFFSKFENNLYNVGISFVIGGAVGNLIDRIFLGGVRDFIFFEFWETYPTFNIADTFLIVGIILIAIYVVFFLKPKEEKKVNQDTKEVLVDTKKTVKVDKEVKADKNVETESKTVKQNKQRTVNKNGK